MVLWGVSCSGSGTSEPPDGFELYEGDGYSFFYPSGWAVEEEGDSGVMVVGPEDPSGLSPAIRVAVQGEVTSGLDEVLSAAEATAATGLLDYEQVSNDPTDVDGAEEAARIEATFRVTAESTGEEVDAVRHEIVALEDETIYALWFTGESGAMENLVDEIDTTLASFTVS
jgi:hypothetical protein